MCAKRQVPHYNRLVLVCENPRGVGGLIGHPQNGGGLTQNTLEV